MRRGLSKSATSKPGWRIAAACAARLRATAPHSSLRSAKTSSAVRSCWLERKSERRSDRGNGLPFEAAADRARLRTVSLRARCLRHGLVPTRRPDLDGAGLCVLRRVGEEGRPLGRAEGEVGAVRVLGVADVDGAGAGGDLDAVVTLGTAVAGLPPGDGDFDAVAFTAAAVAALEPDQV
ncbi:exported hypothetical protein [Actinacidiphila cocklensis]|uniref:Uncharacterized protein n=1 Tax=Actinacidiphila cocklensis TaxID=887465 RepID=A0A9W4E570_9ACTN|nr:exported hypothetical protein [Actinacidiphila cocklensis]